jgi:hypothetical protein
MTRKELEKFLYWLLHQRFMEMVSTIGVDGIAKKYLKETGEDKVALPLDDELLKRELIRFRNYFNNESYGSIEEWIIDEYIENKGINYERD